MVVTVKAPRGKGPRTKKQARLLRERREVEAMADKGVKG